MRENRPDAGMRENRNWADHLDMLEAEIIRLNGLLDQARAGWTQSEDRFRKAAGALGALYYDHSYRSRSAHVNEVLDDPEIQAWIRRTQE